jgi:protein-S-isoprenylcysteine O-methyltransferase Ste14
MNWDAQAKRRWVGAAVLVLALLMLIAGQTVLKGVLKDSAFLGYWGVCMLCTLVAIIIAFMDARAVQRSVGREQRDLLDATLRKIDGNARTRKRRR